MKNSNNSLRAIIVLNGGCTLGQVKAIAHVWLLPIFATLYYPYYP